MRRRLVVASMILVSMSLGACSVSPPARFEAYLGPASVQGRGQEPDRLALPSGRLEAGLLVLNDTTHPGSAPPLSDPRLAALSRRIQDQVEQHFPITVTEVLPASGIAPEASPTACRIKNGNAERKIIAIVISGGATLLR